MTKLPHNFINVLIRLSDLLKDLNYAIRGTASLILQGIDMNVDDIDILCDKKSALETNNLLKDYVVRKVEFSESPKFKSYFGEFNIDGVKVEVIGDWQIKTAKGVWSDVHDGNSFVEIEFEGRKIPVTPIEEELKVFAEMGRWNAYHKIKRQVSSFSQGRQPLESKRQASSFSQGRQPLEGEKQLPSPKTEKPEEPDPQLPLF